MSVTREPGRERVGGREGGREGGRDGGREEGREGGRGASCYHVSSVGYICLKCGAHVH